MSISKCLNKFIACCYLFPDWESVNHSFGIKLNCLWRFRFAERIFQHDR